MALAQFASFDMQEGIYRIKLDLKIMNFLPINTCLEYIEERFCKRLKLIMFVNSEILRSQEYNE